MVLCTRIRARACAGLLLCAAAAGLVPPAGLRLRLAAPRAAPALVASSRAAPAPATPAIGADDLNAASALAMEVMTATPFSARGPRMRKRDRLRALIATVTAPLRALRFARAASNAAADANLLLREACEIDEYEAKGGADCSDAGLFRSGIRELRSLLVRTARSAAGGARASDADAASGLAMEAGWEQRGQGSAFRRTIEVWRFALAAVVKVVRANKAAKAALASAADAASASPAALAEASAAKTAAAIFIRDGLLALGPTFIKLGQVVSTRSDILAKEYIDVLKSLQDDVPGFTGERARAIVESELGRPLSEIFSSFSDTPIAAASLGQVHRATLVNGSDVAVKVQRAGLKELFDLDLKNLKVLATLLDKFDPKTDGADREWAAIYDESARLLYLEIDYLNEARNAMRFAANFGAQAESVRVPRVDLSLSTPRVLTMEFVPSVKLTDISALDRLGLDKEVLARNVAETFLQQLLRDGYFHCDPHPGNLCVDEQGKLVYYDFGMMDELTPQVRDGFRNFCFALFGGGPFVSDAQLAASARLLVEAIGQMGVLSRTADRLAVEKLARFFIRRFKDAQLGGRKGASDIKSTLGDDLRTLTEESVFRFPPTFTFIFRAFASVDGIGKGLDKGYDLGKLAQPFIQQLTSEESSPLQRFGLATGLNAGDIESAVTSPRKIAYLERTVRAMEQGTLKIRVRALENERALERIGAQQGTTQAVVLAVAALNLGALAGGAIAPRLAWAAAAFFGLQAAKGALAVSKLDKKRALYSAPAFDNTALGSAGGQPPVDVEPL